MKDKIRKVTKKLGWAVIAGVLVWATVACDYSQPTIQAPTQGGSTPISAESNTETR